MNGNFSISKVIRYSFLFVFSLFCILMLAFSTLYASKSVSQSFYPDADNGFVWMTFGSNISYGSEWDSFKAPLGIISILQLLGGISTVCMAVYNFLGAQKESLNRTLFISGSASMLLYALEGIIYKNVYCNIMDYKSTYFATASFVPLIIGALMVAGYYLCLKFLPEINLHRGNTHSKNDDIPTSTASEVDADDEIKKLSLLAKYRELNQQGIISDEEFEAKKKQLLNL